MRSRIEHLTVGGTAAGQEGVGLSERGGSRECHERSDRQEGDETGTGAHQSTGTCRRVRSPMSIVTSSPGLSAEPVFS